MTALPIEDPVWRDHFRARVLAERSVFRKLIQWGFTDSASDIYRMIEEKFNDAAEIRAECPEVRFRLTREDRIQLGDLLRERYLKIRDLPRRRASGELLQRGLLTRFQELSAELLQLYAQQFQQRAQKLTVEEAA
jgi:replicative DNA helicase